MFFEIKIQLRHKTRIIYNGGKNNEIKSVLRPLCCPGEKKKEPINFRSDKLGNKHTVTLGTLLKGKKCITFKTNRKKRNSMI